MNVTQRGVVLMETLIAVLVFSVGLIGLAAVQTGALKHQADAAMRARVLLLAADFGERLRLFAGPPPVSALAPDASAAPCADDAPASDRWRCEIADLRQAARELLPGGEARVIVQGPGELRLALKWRGRDATANSPVCADASLSNHCCPADVAAGMRCFNVLLR